MTRLAPQFLGCGVAFVAACSAATPPPPQPTATRIEPSLGAGDRTAPLGDGDERAAACFAEARSLPKSPASCGARCIERCRERDLGACFDLATAMRAEPPLADCGQAIMDLACGAEHTRACVAVADMLLSENPESARARRLLDKACTAGSGAACTRLGALLLAAHDQLGGDITPALTELVRGCDLGDADGCFIAATRYRTGPPYDYVLGAKLLEKSCDLGQAGGCLELGRALLFGGAGMRYDEAAGRQLLNLLCRNDVSSEAGEACFTLAQHPSTAAADAEALGARACDKGQLNACNVVASAHYHAARYAEAIAVSSKLIDKEPDNWSTRLVRGLSLFDTGKHQEAIDDIEAWCRIGPQVHCELYLYAARERAGLDGDSGLAEAWDRIAQDAWPAPVFRYYMGKLGAQQLLKAARHPDAQLQLEQECEAYYYVGQGLLLRGKKKEAIAMFQKSIATQITSFIEHLSATAELARLTP